MKISQMPLSTTPSSDDVLAMLEGGTQNKKITFGAVAEWIANEEEIDNLNTDSKTIVGAMNELAELTSVLPTAQEEIEQLRDSAYITNTVSGDIAVFSDGAAADVKSLIVNIEPIQAGTGDPSPDNVRPISGRTGATVTRTGKNLLIPYYNHDRASNGISWTVQKDSNNNVLSYTANGTATAQSECTVCVNNMILPPGNYIISGVPNIGSTASFAINTYYSSLVTGQTEVDFRLTDLERRFTLNTACQVTVILRIYSGYTADNVVFKPMIRPASIADATYVPYAGTTLPISWETEAGTVYGGELDVVSGVLTVDRASVDLNTLNWTLTTNAHKTYFVCTQEFTPMLPSTGSTILQPILCSKYKTETWNHLVDAPGFDKSITIGWIGRSYIAIYDSDYTDITDFVNSLPGTQFVYKLATPQTYQLTPQQIQTLLGENVVWSDAGSVSVDYRADAKSYINSLFNSIQSNIAFIENGTTASRRAYTAGQYVIVNGTMYKVTAAIASGATFTPDTNIVATTVGTELTALNA